MTKHMPGTREEWLAARLELLATEKELTRRSDELALRRQELAWVRVDKKYRFETDEARCSTRAAGAGVFTRPRPGRTFRSAKTSGPLQCFSATSHQQLEYERV
jgi:Bacterial protein of unknown function (DUF899)